MNQKNTLAIVAAAALTVGGFAFAQDAAPSATPAQPTQDRNLAERTGDAVQSGAQKAGDAVQTGAQKTGDALRDAGTAVKDAVSPTGNAASAHSEEIHDVLAQVAESALTKAGLDDMVERFVDADRNRLGQQQDALKNNTEIDGQIDQLAKDWQTKYGGEFDIGDEDKVYGAAGFASIMAGEIAGDAARTASGTVGATGSAGTSTGASAGTSHGTGTASGTVSGTNTSPGVSVDANANPDTGRANVAVQNNTGVDAPGANTSGQTAADTNRNDPGRNIATLRIAESHGLPSLDVPLIHEAGGWKLDIPDTVDGNKLRDNVKAALADIAGKKDQWPAAKEDAYRHVTHRVLLAVFDKQATGSGAAGSATGSAGH